jgi:hypothetical protein
MFTTKLKKNAMKRIIKVIFAAFLFVLLQSCVTQVPLQRANSENNQSYVIEYLFEHDGCKVYRFFDRGYYVYFSSCNNEIGSINSDSTSVKTIPLLR